MNAFYWFSILGKLHDISYTMAMLLMAILLVWYFLIYDKKIIKETRLLRYLFLAIVVFTAAAILIPSTEELYLIYIQNNIDEVYCNGMLEILEKYIN